MYVLMASSLWVCLKSGFATGNSVLDVYLLLCTFVVVVFDYVCCCLCLASSDDVTTDVVHFPSSTAVLGKGQD